MGRYTTGYVCTKEVMRINLSLLIKQGYIRKGCKVSGTLSWSNGSQVSIRSEYTSTKKYISLQYSITTAEGITLQYDRCIQLISIPSNLGKGEILYFICPASGRRCRILYKCYGSHIWKSRQAYTGRIYYLKQMLTKRSYYLEAYLEAEKQLAQLLSERKSYTYKGKPTKRLQRIEKLQKDMERYDALTWHYAPGFIRQMMY